MPVPQSQKEIIEEHAPDFWPVFWSFAVALFVAVILSFLFFGRDQEYHAYSLVFQSLVLLGVTVVLSCKHHRLLRKQLQNPGFQHASAWVGLALLAPLLTINWFWHGPFLRALGHHEYFGTFEKIGLDGPGLWILFCIFPGIIEEIGFRGLLQPMLMQALPKYKAMLIVAAMFAGIHLSVYSFPYLLLVGLYLGWLREQTRSLYPCMLAHALHNAFVIAFFW